jgi:hypothetical protein
MPLTMKSPRGLYTVERHYGAEPMKASVIANGEVIALVVNLHKALDIACALELLESHGD